MNKSIKWMAHNRVAANLLMMLFIVGGFVSGYSVKQEIFPEIALDMIQISVPYPGASPAEVKAGIILKIEENISAVDGIKTISSLAVEGMAIVTATTYSGEDNDRILQDIKNEIDRIVTFPKDAERATVARLTTRNEIISLIIYGDISEHSLRQWAETIRNDLLDKEEISQISLTGVRPYEISIEISPKKLRSHNLTLQQVAHLIRQTSVDLAGGLIKTAGGEILIQTKGKRYQGVDYGEITVKSTTDGGMVKLKDIAIIQDTFRETDTFAEFNGMAAAMLNIYRLGDQRPTVISRVVYEYIKEKQQTLPPSVYLATWDDTSEILKSRMLLLLKNGGLGLIMVFLVLSLFLQIKLALWVMLGIPISFLGAIFLMPTLNASLNMISLFAFIMALGIVVDSVIVVGENIFEHRKQGKTYLQSAVDGAHAVYIPVTFGILTSVAAFIPLIFVSGTMGKFIQVIPIVVISILLVSLIAALFILPAHLSKEKRGTQQKESKRLLLIDRIRRAASKGLTDFIKGPYSRLLSLALDYRYVTIALAIAMLFVSIGLVQGGIIKFRFMPEVDGDMIIASLKMPPGTLVQDTTQVQEYILNKGKEIIAEFDEDRAADDSVLRHIYTIVGSTLAAGETNASASGPHLANVAMLLTAGEQRNIAAAEITAKWRQRVSEIPGVESLTFTSNLMRMGANIDVQLAHDDVRVLTKAVQRLKQTLADYPGVGDIEDTYQAGKREIKVKLLPEARSLGITEETIGRQLRATFYGSEALRLQRGHNEVRVMVRYPQDERRSLWDLKSMRIHTPDGNEVPLLQIATLVEGRGHSQINRIDRKQVINVTASVDSKKANAEEILLDLRQNILLELMADYQGLTYSLEGEEKERRESIESMMHGFILALFAIYALLAIPFRSYSQPLLIMAAIPFGVIGAIIGHLLMGFDLSLLSLFGIVALSGVVVNSSLLLIDHINRHRQDGRLLIEAVKISSRRRFRPILLTSLTTFFGLMPMIFETSIQAQFLIPMAISLAFGVMFATGITLLLIPALYIVLDDLRGLAENRG